MGLDYVERGVMLSNYLKNINLTNLFIGYNYNTDPYFIGWELNPHNSFIRLHYNFGFLAFIIVGIIFVSVFLALKKSFLVFILLLVLILRGFTDTIFFVSAFDYLFICIFFILNSKKYEHSNV